MSETAFVLEQAGKIEDHNECKILLGKINEDFLKFKKVVKSYLISLI